MLGSNYKTVQLKKKFHSEDSVIFIVVEAFEFGFFSLLKYGLSMSLCRYNLTDKFLVIALMAIIQNPQINVVYRALESHNRTDLSFIVPFKWIINWQTKEKHLKIGNILEEDNNFLSILNKLS